MRASAIIRIIIYCLLIAMLSGILLFGLTAENFSWDFFTIHTGGVNGQLTGGTEAAEKAFSASEIQQIVIFWVNGNVEIVSEDTDTITYQTQNNTTSFETVYKLENGRLSIGFSGTKWNSTKIRTKDLSLTLPRSWAGKLLKVEAVSADVNLSSLTGLQKLELESVSGSLNVSAVNAAQLNVDTVSGNMHFQGIFEAIDIESVSARCTIDASAACPKTVDMDTVSGDLTLYLPEGYGFDLKLDALSKSLHTSLPYTKDGDRYICNSALGNCQIDMDSVSGDITIEPK